MVLTEKLRETQKHLQVVDGSRESHGLADTLFVIDILRVFDQLLVQSLLLRDLLVLFVSFVELL